MKLVHFYTLMVDHETTSVFSTGSTVFETQKHMEDTWVHPSISHCNDIENDAISGSGINLHFSDTLASVRVRPTVLDARKGKIIKAFETIYVQSHILRTLKEFKIKREPVELMMSNKRYL